MFCNAKSIYIYIFTCIYIYIYIYTDTPLSLSLYIYIYIYIYIQIQYYWYTHIYIYIYVCCVKAYIIAMSVCFEGNRIRLPVGCIAGRPARPRTKNRIRLPVGCLARRPARPWPGRTECQIHNFNLKYCFLIRFDEKIWQFNEFWWQIMICWLKP